MQMPEFPLCRRDNRKPLAARCCLSRGEKCDRVLQILKKLFTEGSYETTFTRRLSDFYERKLDIASAISARLWGRGALICKFRSTNETVFSIGV